MALEIEIGNFSLAKTQYIGIDGIKSRLPRDIIDVNMKCEGGTVITVATIAYNSNEEYADINWIRTYEFINFTKFELLDFQAIVRIGKQYIEALNDHECGE